MESKKIEKIGKAKKVEKIGKAKKIRKVKPIRIKKSDRRCPNCKHYRSFECGLRPGEQIPMDVFNSGCKIYKRSKIIFF